MKHVMISGCSRGLGEAMAIEFHRLGWAVSGFSRSEKPVVELRHQLSDRAELHCLDIKDESSVKSFTSAAIDRFGVPDLLLNNAAIINKNAPLWQVSETEFRELMEVNLIGIHRMIRHVLPCMIQAKSGVIVNFSSGWGRSTAPDVATYCATKWGVEGLSASLAQELPRGLACVALNPGVIDTAMLRSCFGGDASHYPTPRSWAAVAVPFLCKLGQQDNGRALTVPSVS